MPAGVIAALALILAVAWPETVHANGYVEPSLWSYFLFGFHFLAVAGCVRGSIIFMWRRRGTLSRSTLVLPSMLLALAASYLALAASYLVWLALHFV